MLRTYVKETNCATNEDSQLIQASTDGLGLAQNSSQVEHEMDGCRIVNGDCIDVLAKTPSESIQFVLTDPPYLVNYRSRDGRGYPNDDNDSWLKPAFSQIFRVLKSNAFCVSFYGWSKVDRFMNAWRSAGFRPVGHLVFPKRYTSKRSFLAYRHEQAYLLAKGNPRMAQNPIPDVLDWNYSFNRLHPSQKPVCAVLPLIESFSKAGEIVLDPFCGSGTTLVAAKMLGRKFLGIELASQYYEIAKRRISEMRPSLNSRTVTAA